MKIVLLPLDERPCNLNYPSLMPVSDDVEIVTPDRSILSLKKKRCDLTILHNWLFKECKDADYLICSVDTLLYGGIVPSRLHHDSLEEITDRSNVLRLLKENNPKIKIYANELIMRTPCYSYSDEEPDYFDECGHELWKYGVYLDLKELGEISPSELEEFNKLDNELNKNFLLDLMTRREINKKAIFHTINLYKEGIIDYLVIPQDDCHPHGFTARDRRSILAYISEINLGKELLMYPGADEAGLTLLSYCLNDYYKTSLKTHVIFASDKGRTAIPNFEDSPVEKTILCHIKACGLTYVSNYEEADLLLFVNNGDFFIDGYYEDIENFNASRDLTHFIDKMIKGYKEGKIIGIADNAFCNKGDEILFNQLFKNEMFDKIHSYAGWNTSSNTLDTTICAMVTYFFSRNDEMKRKLLLHRFTEDYFYMGFIRDEIIAKINANPKWKIKINDLGSYKNPLAQLTKERLERLIYKYSLNNLYWANKISVDFIWNRTFEIDLKIE